MKFFLVIITTLFVFTPLILQGIVGSALDMQGMWIFDFAALGLLAYILRPVKN